MLRDRWIRAVVVAVLAGVTALLVFEAGRNVGRAEADPSARSAAH